MEYNKFKNEIVEKIKEWYGADAEVTLKEVKKNNCVNDGIQIRMINSGNCVCPVVYLNDIYKDFAKARWNDIDEVAEFIVDLYEEHVIEGSEKFSDLIDNFSDWSYAKDHVYPMLIPMKNNEEFVSELIHKEFLDFAVIYYVSGSDCSEGTYSIKITPQLFERYGISLEELDDQAQKNNSSEKYTVLSMYQTLMDLIGGEEFEENYPGINEDAPNLYVISSKEVQFGAAGILNKEVLMRVEEQVGKRFYILPSSIYEVLVTPDDGSISKNELNDMVASVNDTELQVQDVLSDHVYYYNEGEISIAA